MNVLRLAMALAVAVLCMCFAAATAPYLFQLSGFPAYLYILGFPAAAVWFADWCYWR